MVLIADEICISSLIWDREKNTRSLRKICRDEEKYASTEMKIHVANNTCTLGTAYFPFSSNLSQGRGGGAGKVGKHE